MVTTGSSGEPADTLARILERATRLFVMHGYRGISMREIGEAAGISKAGLYYHFKDKEDLFIAILQNNVLAVGRIVARAQAAQTTARGQVRQLMQEILRLPPEERALIRMASQELIHISPEARTAFQLLYQEQFIGALAALLNAAVARGELRAVKGDLAAWLLLGMAYPFFYAGHAADAPDAIAALIVDVFFDGLGLPPA